MAAMAAAAAAAAAVAGVIAVLGCCCIMGPCCIMVLVTTSGQPGAKVQQQNVTKL